MRTVRDRIRQALAFEIIGLILVMVLGAPLFGIDLADLGVVAVGASLIATVWNYVYNLSFDHLLVWIGARKTIRVRVIHAIAFEAGLLIFTLPMIVWWLAIPWLEALVMDVALAAFYVVYAFVFTWIYDRVFPVPERRPTTTGSCGCP